jgi:hypothetical protein
MTQAAGSAEVVHSRRARFRIAVHHKFRVPLGSSDIYTAVQVDAQRMIDVFKRE